jgi:predicted nucleotide-binding protein
VPGISEHEPIQAGNQISQAIIPPKNKNVFIVHGHDEAKKWELKNFLTGLHVQPIVLHEQDDLGKTIIEKFEYYASQSAFACILMTPDDQPPVASSAEAKWRARQNVIMELGWFMAKLGRERIVILYKGTLEIPSDIYGVIYLEFRDSVQEVGEKIRQRLQGVGLIP